MLPFHHVTLCIRHYAFLSLIALLCEQNRFGYDHFGGYERGVGGRAGYADDRPVGRFPHRSGGGFQNGISGTLIIEACK